MIVDADITGTVAGIVSGTAGRYEDGPVRSDLAYGWTLCSGNQFRNTPEKLRLVGRHFSYVAKLSGYRLPEGLCICGKLPCRCREAHKADADEPGALILISATRRVRGDRTDHDVLFNDRYQELFRGGKRLDPGAHRALTARWTRVHANAQRPKGRVVKQWTQLNELLAFLADEESGMLRLAHPPLDEAELEEGQLVLLAKSAGEAARAAVDFVYRLPRLNVDLRVEDLDEERLLLDCGDCDPIRIDQHLRGLPRGELYLAKDAEGTSKQIERAKWALRDAAMNWRLTSLIEQPALAQSSALRRAQSFFNPELDEHQRVAVNAALAAEDVLVVQGPPGTGKTTFICEAVRQYLARDEHTRILLAAQTHQAIDNVLIRLADADPDLPMARVGSKYVADRMEKSVRERFWVQSPEPWMPRVRLRAEAFRRMAQAWVLAGDADAARLGEILAIQEDYFVSEGPQRDADTRIVAARVVAGTCFAVSANPTIRKLEFGVAFLEEAGKATPPEALMLMLGARKSILIGDSRQLPPFVWKPLREALRNPERIASKNPELDERAAKLTRQAREMGETAQERMSRAEETLFDHFAAHLQGTPHETTLNTQYRMAPAIGELVSEVFYAGQLRHGRSANLSDRDPRVVSFAGDAQVRLIDVPGRQRSESSKSRSNLREEEIDCIREQLSALHEHAMRIGPVGDPPKPLGVAIITPYAAQRRRLKKALDLTLYPALQVRIGIVDRFQGDEDCVVIVSFVNTTYAGFLKIPNRINVALSRAMDLLIITTALQAAREGTIGEQLQRVADFVAARTDENDARYEIVRSPVQAT
jgi:AAA domain